MASPFLLNVGGVWIPLLGVQRGVSRKKERPVSPFITLGGSRFVQRADRAPRTWDLAFSFSDPSATAWLQEAANGDAGDIWLLDRMAAQKNMLPPRATKGRYNGQPSIATALGIQVQTFSTGVAFTRLVRQGQWYHLSGWTTVSAGATIGVLTVGAETPVNVIAPTGAGARPWSTAFNPAADATVSFSISIAAKTTRLRLTESSVDQFDWVPGEDTPCKVAVMDPDDTLSLYRPGHAPLSDSTVTVLEVG